MSTDGAHLGIGAGEAMKAVIGGEEPTERVTTGELFDRIMSRTEHDSLGSYDGAAEYTAKLIIEYLRADPRRAQIPNSTVFGVNDDGTTNWSVVVEKDLYACMKDDGLPLSDLGLSGFQWGWATNAARACMELPPVPNPAIIDIGGAA